MDSSPNLILPYIIAAQAQKHVTHNEALRRLDALVQLMVLDKDLSSPPGSPADGARYIVAASPSGAWSGQAGRIAAWQDGAWTFYAPNEGWRAWVADEDKLYFWDGAAWTAPSMGGGGAAASAVGLHNGKITESHASNAATFALKTLAGADPSSGDPVTAIFPDGSSLSITAALSITIPSGATMGFANGTAGRIWVALAYDAGTPRLVVRNCRSGATVIGFPASGLITTTAIDAAADNAQVSYSGTAVTAKPFLLAAFADYDSGLTTAGTWDASPSRVVQFGRGIHKPGDVIQDLVSSTGAVSSSATAIPSDDTIPQNTEGFQVLSQSVTPNHAANLLRIRAFVNVANDTTAAAEALALFQDSTANALAASTYQSPAANYLFQLFVQHCMPAGTASSTTFKARVGGNAGTTTFNGQVGNRLMGGVHASFLSIEEIMG